MPDGVLLCALGAPATLDEVGRFLEGIRRGRPTPPELVDEFRARYARIGGGSPLGRISEAQAERLEAHYRAAGQTRPCRYGAVVGSPSLDEALDALEEAGAERLSIVPLTPYYSRWGVGTYLAEVRTRLRARGHIGPVRYVTGWHLEPRWVEGWTERIRSARARLRGRTGADPVLLFSAHSLPVRASASGDPYVRSLERTREAILARLGPARSIAAYQSVGRTGEAWLGPSVESVVDELPRATPGGVLLAAYGFAADNLEVLYDLDIELKERAARRGIELERVPSPNADPDLIAALADVVGPELPSARVGGTSTASSGASRGGGGPGT